jgi:hypothetical protein
LTSLIQQCAQGNVTVERAALAVHLVKEARRLYPAIRFQFDTMIQVLPTLHHETTGYNLHANECIQQ